MDPLNNRSGASFITNNEDDGNNGNNNISL